MKVKLNTYDRLAILQFLPKEGSVIRLRIVKDLNDLLSFSEDELKEKGISDANGQLIISKDKFELNKEGKEFDLSEAKKDIIKDELIKLEKSDKLHISLLELYDKFVGDKDDSQNSN